MSLAFFFSLLLILNFYIYYCLYVHEKSTDFNSKKEKKDAVSSIYPIDRALSGANIPGENEPDNGNEGVFRIPQSSSITGTSASDYLVSYTGHSLVGVYSAAPADLATGYSLGKSLPSAEMPAMYSAASADLTRFSIWTLKDTESTCIERGIAHMQFQQKSAGRILSQHIQQ